MRLSVFYQPWQLLIFHQADKPSVSVHSHCDGDLLSYSLGNSDTQVG